MSALPIAVHKFWSEFKPGPDPAQLVRIDMVAYGPPFGNDRSVTVERVDRLLNKLIPMTDGVQNPAVVMAHQRADAIRPLYEAWVSGQEAPQHGTPLAAWNALTPEQAEILKTNQVKTVEDVASLTDGVLTRIQLPNMRALKAQAQRFLDSADQVRVAHSLAQKDQEIAALASNNAEQANQIAALMEKVNQLAEMVAARDDDKPGDKSAKNRKAA